MKPAHWSILVLLALHSPLTASAQIFDEDFNDWPVDLKINGVIVAAGGLDNSDLLTPVFYRYRELHTTIIHDDHLPKAFLAELQSRFDTWAIQAATKSNGDSGRPQKLLPPLESLPPPKLTTEQLSEDIPQQLATAARNSKVIFLALGKRLDGQQRRQLAEASSLLKAFVGKEGVLICDGDATETLSAMQITNHQGQPIVERATGLLTDCVVETDYEPGDQRRLQSVLAIHPTLVGVGIERNTAIILAGRKIQAIGSGAATFCLVANERQPIRLQTIRPPSARRSPEEWLIDLTEWRRDAIDRTLPPFPPAKPRPPTVEKGTLVIVGGGGMPKGLMEKFVELAGGKDNAKMVYVPCSEQDRVRPIQSTVEMWKKMGVKHATFIHTKDRIKANSDEEFYAPLRDATAIWFGGGRQWNFSDSYYGTKTHQLMKEVLRRGGVIGGSSAGASIQARYLARATPIGNFRIMAPGYERGGLGFLSGVAIDQHFSQRGRQKDMTQLMSRHPQLLGIGLDEATAIIVQNSQAEVVGKAFAHFYDRNLPVYPDQADFIALPAGSVYDLAARKVITDTRKNDKDEKEDAEKEEEGSKANEADTDERTQ